MTIPTRSLGVNPLQTTWLERGAVRSRVALLLRSSETQPLFNDLSSIDRTCPQASDQSPVPICSRGCLSCFPQRWPSTQVLSLSWAVALSRQTADPFPSNLYGCLFSSAIGSICILHVVIIGWYTSGSCGAICSRGCSRACLLETIRRASPQLPTCNLRDEQHLVFRVPSIGRELEGDRIA